MMGLKNIVIVAAIVVFFTALIKKANLFKSYPSKINKQIQNIVAISVIFRHGDRRPDFLWPSYPNPNSVFYPEGPGSLTNTGKLRSYNIGKALRKRYDALLGDIVESETVFCLSSDYARTRRSLLYLLAGLYPPKSVQIWNDDLKWQAIPYNYVPISQDKILFGCFSKEGNMLIDEYKSTSGYKNLLDKHRSVMQIIHNNTGLPNLDFMEAGHIFATLNSLEKMNISLPAWSSDIHPGPVQDTMVDLYKLLTFNDLMTAYTSGFLLEDMLTTMWNQISGKLVGRKISLYSGHDLNIAGMMRLLNVYDNKIPQYSSYMIFELHLIDGIYGVRALYQNYHKEEPIPLILPDCDEICPFDKFIELVRTRLPTHHGLSKSVLFK